MKGANKGKCEVGRGTSTQVAVLLVGADMEKICFVLGLEGWSGAGAAKQQEGTLVA